MYVSFVAYVYELIECALVEEIVGLSAQSYCLALLRMSFVNMIYGVKRFVIVSGSREHKSGHEKYVSPDTHAVHPIDVSSALYDYNTHCIALSICICY